MLLISYGIVISNIISYLFMKAIYMKPDVSKVSYQYNLIWPQIFIQDAVFPHDFRKFPQNVLKVLGEHSNSKPPPHQDIPIY